MACDMRYPEEASCGCGWTDCSHCNGEIIRYERIEKTIPEEIMQNKGYLDLTKKRKKGKFKQY